MSLTFYRQLNALYCSPDFFAVIVSCHRLVFYQRHLPITQIISHKENIYINQFKYRWQKHRRRPQTQFAGKDMQDYIAMVIIWYATQSVSEKNSSLDQTELLNGLKKLEEQINKAL